MGVGGGLGWGGKFAPADSPGGLPAALLPPPPTSTPAPPPPAAKVKAKAEITRKGSLQVICAQSPGSPAGSRPRRAPRAPVCLPNLFSPALRPTCRDRGSLLPRAPPQDPAAQAMLQADWNPQGGFSFKNCQRNAFLESSLKGLRVPHARKTGTTIAGLVFQDGVILGADTRATNDSVVADKNCEKIHFIAPNIYCCGAGVAADAEMTTQMMASNMELHALSTGRKPRVVTVTRMLRQMLFRYQGHIGASLIVGGVDITGPLLYSVHPHGSYSRLLFTALGSGQEAAISVLEDRFKPNMTLEEGQQLIVEAVTAGILDDLGSGSNVDMCVITQAGAKIQRAVSTPAVISKRQGKYRYPKGTTAVMKETVTPLALEMIEETVQTMEVE